MIQIFWARTILMLVLPLLLAMPVKATLKVRHRHARR